MILAAADYAEDPKNNPMPPELELAFQVMDWNTLPEPGGLRDQRLGELNKMNITLNVYHTIKEMNEAESFIDWQKNNPKGWKLYSDLLELRKHGETK